MSWLARSIANSLSLDDEDNRPASSGDEENDAVTMESQSSPPPIHKIQNEETEVNEEHLSLSHQQEHEPHSYGIKEDLTELKDNLTRQFFGVASFLAPPPPPPPPPLPRSPKQFNGQSNDRSFYNLNQSEQSLSRHEENPSDSVAVAGIINDLAEIGGTMSKMTSDYLPIGLGENEEENGMENGSEEEEEEDQEFDVIGITDEVLAFASNIAHHPETWLDFPLDPDEDLDDFDMTIAQQDHAMAIEYLAPSLAALRIELCPCHMSDGYFWKVYFVLLHSRLNKTDAEILSTPQVMEARALWMKELQKKTKPETDWYGGSTSHLGDSHSIMQNDLIPSSSNFTFETMSPRTYAYEPASIIPANFEAEKHLVESTEMPFVDKSIIDEKQVSNAEDKGNVFSPLSKRWIPDPDEEEIVWPEDEFGGYVGAAICAEDVEDISFSDLEDSDDSSNRTKFKLVSKGSETSKT